MRYMGIDVGLTRSAPTAVAILEGTTLLHHESLHMVTGIAWWDRLPLIRLRLVQIVHDFGVDGVGCEAAWVGENEQTTIKLSAVLGVGLTLGVPALPVQPTQAMAALLQRGQLGRGENKKQAMVAAARLYWQVTLSHHEADAAGIALYTQGHFDRQRAIQRGAMCTQPTRS